VGPINTSTGSWPTPGPGPADGRGDAPPEDREVQSRGISHEAIRYPCSIPDSPPLLGEHTEEVLREVLGYDKETIARLKEGKVI